MGFKTLLSVATVVVALAGGAQAGTITVNGPPGCSGITCINSASLTATSAAGAASAPFTLGNFGNAGTNGLVSTAPIAISGGTIAFVPNASSPQAGVYSGNVPGTSTSPFSGTALPASNYLVAEPNDPVTFTFNQPQTAFSLLWGSVDSFNSLHVDFLFVGVPVGNLTVTGTQVASAIGSGFAANGTTSAFVTLSNYVGIGGLLSGFDQIVISSTQSAFEFVPSVQVPEPASLALLGAGLAVLGFVRRRRARTA